MEEIGRILPGLFRSHVGRSAPPLIELLTPLWPRIVGEAIAQQSRPLTFADGALTVGTSCPSWAAQLRYLGEEIRAEVNSYLGRSVVKKLRVKYAPEAGKGVPPARKDAPARASTMPALSRMERIADLDPEISGIVERSFAKYFARRVRRVH